MMNTRKLLPPLFAALFGLATSAFAQTVTTEATVARVNGAATVTMPDGSTTALAPGMKVPQGATIKTGADGDVYLESHAGYVTAIKKDSELSIDELSVTSNGGKVTEEKTLLNLKSGDMVALLDPKKKAVNNYQVRTPKGVAAARGTVFTVSYRGGNYTLAVVRGQIQIIAGAGVTSDNGRGGQANQTGTTFTLNAGQATFSNPGDQTYQTPFPLSDLSKQGQNAVAQFLSVAIATVAVAAENNIGGTTSEELKSVTTALVAAYPAAADQISALVKASAPTQASVVDQVITTTTGTTPPATPVTTPQPIDPSTVSRSN